MKINLKVILLLLVLVTTTLKEQYNSIAIILLSVYGAYELLKFKTFDQAKFKKLVPFLFLYILVFLSVFYSENQDSGWKMVIRLLPLLLFPLIFSIINIKKKEFIYSIKGFIVWMLGVCLFSHTMILIKLFRNNDKLYNLFNNNYSYLSLANETIGVHTTYYAYCVLVAIFFVLFLLFEKGSKISRVIYFAFLIYFSFFIFHLSARTPIAVMFLTYNVAIFYYFLKSRKVKEGVITLLLFYIMTGIILYNVRVTRYRFQQVIGFTYYDGSHHEDGEYKLKQWEAAISANKNKIFGNGIGDANSSIFNAYPNFGLDKYKERRYNAHNQFIQTYVGLGFIGLGVLLFIFISFIIYFFKQKFLLGTLFVPASFILFFTESFLERQIGIVLFVYMICYFTALFNFRSLK